MYYIIWLSRNEIISGYFFYSFAKLKHLFWVHYRCRCIWINSSLGYSSLGLLTAFCQNTAELTFRRRYRPVISMSTTKSVPTCGSKWRWSNVHPKEQTFSLIRINRLSSTLCSNGNTFTNSCIDLVQSTRETMKLKTKYIWTESTIHTSCRYTCAASLNHMVTMITWN